LAARLGFAASRGTILRHLVRHQRLPDDSTPRVIGIDEWASRKGLRFGTIAVDLERRTVIDVLPDRSAVSTAVWLAERPSIELIARDRDGLYADASRRGAPQAKQIADRFHLVQNLRATIQRQLSGLERPIRGYRATPNRPLRTDGIQLDGEVGDALGHESLEVQIDRAVLGRDGEWENLGCPSSGQAGMRHDPENQS
jgi:hypothetical protein